jgi:hypothetical protein
MTVQVIAHQLLFVLGLGFLVANVQVARDLVRYRHARRSALLVWRRPRPPYFRFYVLLGVIQALLLASLILLRRPVLPVFGLAMMLLYFLAATPLSMRIDRGFYETGVWSDRGFVPWSQISGISWRENPVTLLLLSRMRSTASPLQVPTRLYGEARRVLRERVRLHGFQGDHAGLELTEHDAADEV